MFEYSLFSLLRATVFSRCFSVGLVLLNRRTLIATVFYETYNISIVEKHNRFIIFSEHKLYEFLQREKGLNLECLIRYQDSRPSTPSTPSRDINKLKILLVKIFSLKQKMNQILPRTTEKNQILSLQDSNKLRSNN